MTHFPDLRKHHLARIGWWIALGGFVLSGSVFVPIKADQPIATPVSKVTPGATIPPNATPVPVLSGAQIKPGMIVSSTLHDAGATARYVIFGAYGDLISVGVFPAAGQTEAPTIELDAPDGTIAGASNGLSGGVPGALIPALTLPSTGVYELYVQAIHPQAVGAYTVRITNDWILRDLDGGQITPEALTVGRLMQVADRQNWHLTLTAGTKFTVLAQPAGDGTLDPVIDVLTPQGDRLGVAHDFSIIHKAQTDQFTAPVTGDYLIRISAYVDTTVGAYDLIIHLGAAS